MTCLDLAQHVLCVMSARAQCDKLPEFYMQIALTFLNSLCTSLNHDVHPE